MLTSDSNEDLIKMPTNYPRTIQSSSGQQCSLQHQLGLESKPLLFHDLCMSWRASAQATLNLHQTFIQQSKKNIHKFCQQVQQSTPWILKYENCWPAKFYVFIYLRHKVRKGKKTSTLITQFYAHQAVAEPSPLKGAAIVGKGIPRHLRILSASDKAINNFLNSLWIPQPTLLPLLHSLGITSSWHLKAFANLTNQKKWLEDLVD
ncbi:unnamed protein product [Somion occarium]|uniref:Uncharacterized protein n=1 Tax=Somion occarium TaxID=3059160 RepID=A0ABP1DBZ4_9APHY